jgi:Fe2+ transport system protein B
MINIEEIKRHLNDSDLEDTELSLLSDIDEDEDFKRYISKPENQFLNNIRNNPRTFNNNKEATKSLILKYIPWKIWKDSSLDNLGQKVKGLEKQVEESENSLNEIKKSAKYVGGAEILVAYSKRFKKTARKHEREASRIRKHYYYSLIGFGVIIVFTFLFSIGEFESLNNLIADDMKVKFNLSFLAIKLFLLIFAFQITQFFKKNYNAEKHLQEVYQHRSDVLQSLHAVYNSLTDNSKERNEILNAGALFAYDRGETGYITTKEGAGSDDNLIQGIFGRFFN